MPVMNPVLLNRTTVTASAICHLREQIVDGHLLAGESLPEAKIGLMLGISRAPIREALTILEREGLIAFDRRGTARVCEFGLAEVRELGLMRLALEPIAALQASERRPAKILSLIEENLQSLKEASELDEVTHLDLDFHRLIVAATENSRLKTSWENLASQFLLVMKRFHQAWEKRTKKVRESTARAHAELFRAIRLGLAEEAEVIARRHASAWLSELEQSNAFASKSEESE